MCLLHKELEFERVPLERLTIKETVQTDPKTVPVLESDGRQIVDSFEIVRYLEERYPDKPLFSEGDALADNGLSKYRDLNSWVDRTLVSRIFRMIVKDVNELHSPENRAQFRLEKEPAIGETFEEAHAKREVRLTEFRTSLDPLRERLEGADFLSGDEPMWFDYCVFGTFQWARIAGNLELLAEDDVLVSWMDRMLDLFGGYGKSAKLAY